MANPIMTIAQALEADIRTVCGWDASKSVFFGEPRTQPTERDYAIVEGPGMNRVAGNTSPTHDHYRLSWTIKFRFSDTDNTIIRLGTRSDTWLKMRAKLTPDPVTNGGSSAYHGGFACTVPGGELKDFNNPEEPDTDLSIDFETTIKLQRGATNIT